MGSGNDRAAALYGALKYWVGGAMRAGSEDLEEFAYGAKEVTSKGDALVITAARESVGRAIEMLPGTMVLGLKPLIISDQWLSIQPIASW